MKQCRNCEAGVGETDVLCSVCGAMVMVFGEEEISCENHPGERAVACCYMCGKPVCGDCATSAGGLFLCDVPEHCQAAEQWAAVAFPASPFEADMLKANLAQAGIPVRVADPREFAGSLWFRPQLQVRILVERANLESALSLLRSFQLVNSDS